MKLSITKEFRFEAAHLLPLVADGHKCKRLHGHSFRVEVELAGDVGRQLSFRELRPDGMVCDFADVSSRWAPLHAELDHRYLNDVAGLENPTSEMIAVWIWERLQVGWPAGVQIERVTVHETCTASATVRW